ncbi:hypothetical protein [Pantoea agglomerans]|nr:hypothetical protein [Pantoea agglomerans]
MFSKSDLEKMDDEQLNLYMDWLLESISRYEVEADASGIKTPQPGVAART